jgi:hypothetical protein
MASRSVLGNLIRIMPAEGLVRKADFAVFHAVSLFAWGETRAL